jgi:hypothetical protein
MSEHETTTLDGGRTIVRNGGSYAFTRIPPPPPLHNDDDYTNNHNHNIDFGPVYPWVLKIKCLTKSGSPVGIRIQVYPTMVPETLGRCISQAVSSYNSMTPETIVVST